MNVTQVTNSTLEHGRMYKKDDCAVLPVSRSLHSCWHNVLSETWTAEALKSSSQLQPTIPVLLISDISTHNLHGVG